MTLYQLKRLQEYLTENHFSESMGKSKKIINRRKKMTAQELKNLIESFEGWGLIITDEELLENAIKDAGYKGNFIQE